MGNQPDDLHTGKKRRKGKGRRLSSANLKHGGINLFSLLSSTSGSTKDSKLERSGSSHPRTNSKGETVSARTALDEGGGHRSPHRETRRVSAADMTERERSNNRRKKNNSGGSKVAPKPGVFSHDESESNRSFLKKKLGVG